MPPPTKSNKDESEREPVEFPFTKLYLYGLELGFSTADLHVMDYPSLLWFARASAPPASKKGKSPKNNTRKATQADINALLG